MAGLILHEGIIETKGKNWTKVYGVLQRGRLDLYSDKKKKTLRSAVIISKDTVFREEKKKYSFSLMDSHFKVDSKDEREAWRKVILQSQVPDGYSGSRTLPSPGRKGGPLPLTTPSCYSTDFCHPPLPHSQDVYDDCLGGRGVRFLDNQGSPIDDSGIDSGGTQFNMPCTGEKGRSDDGIARQLVGLPRQYNPAPRSAGNSPFTSPGSSADGVVRQLEKYQWYLGEMDRTGVESYLKDVQGGVFCVRQSNKGYYVICVRKPGSNLAQHKLVAVDNRYYVDGIKTFSGSSIFNLVEVFAQNFSETPPLGGSVNTLKSISQGDDDPAYDYAWDPDQMAGLIEKKLMMQKRKQEGGQYVDLVKPSPQPLPQPRPQPAPQSGTRPSKGPPPPTPTKPRGKGKSPQPSSLSSSGASGNSFASELKSMLVKGPVPKPKPKPRLSRPSETTPPECDQIYENHTVDSSEDSIYANVPAQKPSRRSYPPPPAPVEDEELYVASDNNPEDLYMDPDNQGNEEDLYVDPNNQEDEMYVAVDNEQHIYAQDLHQGGHYRDFPPNRGNSHSNGFR